MGSQLYTSKNCVPVHRALARAIMATQIGASPHMQNRRIGRRCCISHNLTQQVCWCVHPSPHRHSMFRTREANGKSCLTESRVWSWRTRDPKAPASQLWRSSIISGSRADYCDARGEGSFGVHDLAISLGCLEIPWNSIGESENTPTTGLNLWPRAADHSHEVCAAIPGPSGARRKNQLSLRTTQ